MLHTTTPPLTDKQKTIYQLILSLSDLQAQINALKIDIAKLLKEETTSHV